MSPRLTVAINAELPLDGSTGGIEQFLMSLVRALGQVDDGPERYLLIVRPDCAERMAAARGANQEVVARPRRRLLRAAGNLLGRFGTTVARWRQEARYRRLGAAAFQAPVSDGFFEALHPALVHFPYQQFEVTQLPSIFNPHDLQHRHYPEFFSPMERANREAIFGAGCRQSAAVAAESAAARVDIMREFGIPPERVFTVLRGAPTQFYSPLEPSALDAVRREFHLPDRFAFYPAQFWPHKNHLRLVEAVARIRDVQGVRVHVVCSGRQSHAWAAVRDRVQALGLREQVGFVGYVAPAQLRALYRLADFLVHPSLFEGGGFPLLEAFNEGTPVTCSNATSLPEYGGDAVLLFDPESTVGIADAVLRMWQDAALRAELRSRGTARATQFTWDRTARTYRALYRKLAGRELGAEDAALLDRAQPTPPPIASGSPHPAGPD